MVLEKLYAHYNHPVTACKLGHVRGVICLLCAQRKIKLVEHSVKRIRIALVGNGNASKLQTQQVVAHMLKIEQSQLTPDASDALALALGYVHIHSRSRIVKLSQIDQKAEQSLIHVQGVHYEILVPGSVLPYIGI